MKCSFIDCYLHLEQAYKDLDFMFITILWQILRMVNWFANSNTLKLSVLKSTIIKNLNLHEQWNTCLLHSKVSRFYLYFRRDSCTWCMSRFTLHYYTISVLSNLLLSPTCWLANQLNDYWLAYWFNSTSESWWLLLIYDICSVPIYYSTMHDLKNCFVHH